MEKDIYKTSRFLYILEAAFSWFVLLLARDAFLAKLAGAIGISDSLTGLLTAFVSLGCGFQFIAIFLVNKRPVKRYVTVLHGMNELCFALLYCVPFIKISQTGKTLLFVLFLLGGYVVYNILSSPKINWYMALVEDKNRGRFTAYKEIVSLIGGFLFTFIMGVVIDKFEAAGNVNGAFAVCGFTVFSLMVVHSVTLLCSKEKPVENKMEVSVKQAFVEIIGDKNVFKVILLLVIGNITLYASTPFTSTYQIKELGWSMSLVSIGAALSAVSQAVFSFPLGKFADKHSFAKMLNICYAISALEFMLSMFTVPSNGKVLMMIVLILRGIKTAGISSATINIVYDYVSTEKRMVALALANALSGFAGFFTTLAVSPLVSYIQNNGNVFLGIQVYAQQVVAVISLVLNILLIVYLNVVVKRIKRKNNEEK